MEGWIKLHRKMLENPVVWKDSDYLAVWVYLLLNATHDEAEKIFDGKKITLQKGQLITGRKAIFEQTKVSESKVQRILKMLENEQQIEQQTCTKNRLITINKWEEYQSYEQQIEQQLNNKRTTTEQQLNTNKNVKNINIYIVEFDALWKQYPNKQGKQKAQQSFIKARQNGTSLEDIEKGLNSYIKSVQGKDTQFIKHGSTWFNQHCWMDEFESKETTTWKPL